LIWNLKVLAVVPLLLASAQASIGISTPANGSSVSSPVHIVASASASKPIIAMRIYVDGASVYSNSTNKIDTYVKMASGKRSVTVQAWDSGGGIQKASIGINVAYSTSSEGSTGGKTFYNIDQMSGWGHCDKCAGIGGDGSSTQYSMSQGTSSPSLDGKAVKFWLGGSTPYSNALWWKQLGGNSAVKNFIYDLWFYIKDPGASQALEFDVNQSTNGRKWIFGSECNMTNTGQWRVWDTANKTWKTTGIPCPRPTAYKWHHVVWELKRDGNYTRFISLTYDGKKYYLNRTYYSKPWSDYQISVAYQMDGNKYQTDYSTWVDKIKLTYW
jgi:hypothetical protein